MEKPFRPAPLELLAKWIFRDLESRDAVLGIPKANFQVPDERLAMRLQGLPLAAPLGVAAGPHTQLTQNIVASWLCGARFIELKTVQILDELTVSRPCIDSADETFNCEWSQELKLEQSFTEYLNAWVLIHALAHKFGLKDPGTLFNMSVGYNLEGIQSDRVQAFIAQMRDASAALPAAIDAVAKAYPAVRDLDIPARLSNHITLSTMHGCPPAEIERIAAFLLTEVKVDTWVKLNPTLLGPERLRGILNKTCGFHQITVPDLAFEHDPRWEDALAMVRNLARLAEGREQKFGLKLSNTLEVVNHRDFFPENEKMMYMSGRSLHPVTLTLANLVNEELDGKVPISFCGGADARNYPDLVADGLNPITVCTDLLKPGGYARLQQYLVNLTDRMAEVGATDLEGYVHAVSGGHGPRFNLSRHVEKVLDDPRYQRRERPLAFKGTRSLGHFDCIAAPCQEACPTHQNIPDYLWHVAHGQPTEALEVILRTNPQPGITGMVCDHPCTERCVRNFYDLPLAIREIKRFAFEHGQAPTEHAGEAKGVKVAIAGAGPAGLSAAYYLAKMGFEPHVFEAKTDLGGMVKGVIPGYRLPEEAIEGDLARLRQMGVTFHMGVRLGADVTLEALRQDHDSVFLGVGAQKGKTLGIPGDTAPEVLDALTFLDKVQTGQAMDLGRDVLVIGGGNSAMDAARSARRLVKDGNVTLVYRRMREQMPADAAEVLDCIEEGIGLRDLLAPAAVVLDEAGHVTGLSCTVMTLGEKDASGRPRPVPAGVPDVVVPASTIIPAISQEPVIDFLAGLEVKRRGNGTFTVDAETRETSVARLYAGGDAVHGPSSVITAIADGRAAAEAIARRHGVAVPTEPELAKDKAVPELMDKKARKLQPVTVPTLPLTHRGGFDQVIQTLAPADAAREAGRCLDCDEVCSLCVTVCPNRANTAYALEPLTLELPTLVVREGALVQRDPRAFTVAQKVQILNVGDFCNECGNCDTFCPTAGAPYKDKPKFWMDPEGYAEAAGDAFRMARQDGRLILEARIQGEALRLEVDAQGATYRSSKVVATFDPAWALRGLEALPGLAEGEEVDLAPLTSLIPLLAAEPVLPVDVQASCAPCATI